MSSNLVCRSRRGEVGKIRKKKTGDKLADARAAIGLTLMGKSPQHKILDRHKRHGWVGLNQE